MHVELPVSQNHLLHMHLEHPVTESHPDGTHVEHSLRRDRPLHTHPKPPVRTSTMNRSISGTCNYRPVAVTPIGSEVVL
jgi:hypothetical protein